MVKCDRLKTSGDEPSGNEKPVPIIEESVPLVGTQVRMPRLTAESPASRTFYMKELLIATGNLGKFKEINISLADLLLKIVSLKDIGLVIPHHIENGNTYAENALKKAQYAARKTGLMCLADDSGIVIDALKDELGTKTRRWGVGAEATDQEWVEHFLRVMKNVPDSKRTATFVCSICLVDEKGKHIKTVKGETTGKISRKLQAPIQPGIPLSSCFLPEGGKKVYAALSTEEKNKLSHRGKAISKMHYFLKTELLAKNPHIF